MVPLHAMAARARRAAATVLAAFDAPRASPAPRPAHPLAEGLHPREHRLDAPVGTVDADQVGMRARLEVVRVRERRDVYDGVRADLLDLRRGAGLAGPVLGEGRDLGLVVRAEADLDDLPVALVAAEA